MTTLEQNSNLGLELTFDELIDIVSSLFQVSIQDYIYIRGPKNSVELYE